MKTTTNMRMYRVEFGVGEEPSAAITRYYVWTHSPQAAVKEGREILNRLAPNAHVRWHLAEEIDLKQMRA